MNKLKVIAKPEIVSSVENKIVCDVTQFNLNKGTRDESFIWSGSVENEYFHVVFTKGVLVIAIAEKECDLLKNTKSYAATECFSEILNKCEKDPTLYEKLKENYETTVLPVELKHINFDDILSILKWKKTENTKFHNDLLLV